MDCPPVGTDVLVRASASCKSAGRRAVVADRIDRGPDRDWVFVRVTSAEGVTLYFEWVAIADLNEI